MACTSAVGDEVGERDLPRLPGRLERLVEPAPLLLQHADRQHAEGGGGGHGQALVHVGDELGGGALDGGGAGRKRVVVGEAAGAAGPPEAVDAGAMAAATAGRGAAAPLPSGRSPTIAALEQPAPLGTHGRGVPEKLLVHDLGEAGVGRFEHVRIHDVHHPDG